MPTKNIDKIYPQLSDRPVIHLEDMNDVIDLIAYEANENKDNLLQASMHSHRSCLTHSAITQGYNTDSINNLTSVNANAITHVFTNLIEERNTKILNRLEERYIIENSDKYTGISYEKYREWGTKQFHVIRSIGSVATWTTKLDLKTWSKFVTNVQGSELLHALLCLVKSKNLNSYNSKSNHSTEFSTHIEELDELNKAEDRIKSNKKHIPCNKISFIQYSNSNNLNDPNEWHVTTDAENSRLLLEAFNKKHKQEYQESDEKLDESPP